MIEIILGVLASILSIITSIIALIPIEIEKSADTEQLNDNDCLLLFKQIYKKNVSKEDEDDLYYIINETLQKNAIAIDYAAHCLNVCDLSISDLRNKLQQSNIKLDKQIYRHLISEFSKLLIINDLSPKEYKILEMFSILPNCFFQINMLNECMKSKCLSDFNYMDTLLLGLVEKGWLIEKDNKYSINRIFSDVLRYWLNPQSKNYEGLIFLCINKLQENIAKDSDDSDIYFLISESLIDNLVPNSNGIAMLSKSVIKHLINRSRYNKAIKYLSKAEIINKTNYGKDYKTVSKYLDQNDSYNINFAEIFVGLASLEEENENHAKASEYYLKAIEIYENMEYDKNTWSYLNIIYGVAAAYSFYNHREAAGWLEKAYYLSTAINGKTSDYTMHFLEYTFILYMMIPDYDNAYKWGVLFYNAEDIRLREQVIESMKYLINSDSDTYPDDKSKYSFNVWLKSDPINRLDDQMLYKT